MPPGPTGLPIIGNLLDLGPKPHESLAKLSKKHGPLMTIRLGSITSVVASTPDAAREILLRNDEACSGRIVPDAVTALDNNDAAVLWIPTNDEWRTIRKALNTCLTHQHKLDSLRNLRGKVVHGMLEFLRECMRKHEPVDIGKLAFATAVKTLMEVDGKFNIADIFPVLKPLDPQNIRRQAKAAYDWFDKVTEGFICTRLKHRESKLPRFGDMLDSLLDYSQDNEADFSLVHIKTLLVTLMEVDGKFNIADIFPVLKPLDPQNIRRQAKAAYDWFDKVTEGFISERLKHRESKLPRFGDMLDSLLDYSQDNEADFSLVHIKTLLVDLFLAGTETSSNTTEWAMTELLLNPDMFSKLREEISTIVGEDGKIQEAKILDLPYLNAVIKETMRLHLSVPLLVPHKTETEVKLGEYVVPKNTQILVNAWAMARDPSYWKDPVMFKPERFLGNELDYKGQHFEFIPFGSGRRMCPGIPLAHRVVSLMVASFVCHFEWKLPHAREEMDMNDIFGLTLLRATPLVATPLPVA
ncbi:geraniol 8-hydroxylase-like protein [Tanacetum coccineum]